MSSVAQQGEEFEPSYSPRVVRLKKEKGKIVQDCDVYIGNAIKNSSWKLAQSKWFDPCHERWDLLPTQRMEKYKMYILSHPLLIRSLRELCGQCLGCLCRGGEYCHGHVLVDLVKTRYKNDFFSVTTKGPLYFFKGAFYPLSNCYPASLKLPEENEGKKIRTGGNAFPWVRFNCMCGRGQRNPVTQRWLKRWCWRRAYPKCTGCTRRSER